MFSKPQEDRYLKNKGSFDIELAIASEILKVPSLHYGYWTNGEKPTLATLPKAQTRYTEFVCKQVPKGVRTILDVGAGLGDVSVKLLKAGYRVTALSPNPTHKSILEKIDQGHKNFNFVFGKFEDYESHEKYDLIMFNESSSYIDTDKLFSKSTELVNQNGYLQICDVFSRTSPPPIGKNITYKNLLSLADKYKYLVIKNIDITKKATPSLQIGYDFNQRYLKPALEIARRYYLQEHPIRSFLVRLGLNLFLKKEIKSFNDYFEKVFNPEEFKKYFTYKLVLLQKI